MNRSAWHLFRLYVGLVGALAIILLFPLPANSGSPVEGKLIITADPEQEVNPAIAYNSQRHEYLAVWFNDRPGCDDVRARRIDRKGLMIGSPFYISAGCPDDRRYPQVAYNNAQDQYLVVWEQYNASNGYSIKGRRVSGNGQLLDTTDITIYGPGYNLYTPVEPQVAYASTSDRYLVIWAETWHPLPISYSIKGQVMTGAGSVEGSDFEISQGTNTRGKPALAYNRHANRYLVVWEQDAGVLWDIHGQQVHGGGGLFQGDITIAYYTRSSTAPAVAAMPTSPFDEKFLVVWELDYAANDRDIYGRLIKEDGTPGPDFWVSWSNGVDESSPTITATESNTQYFVAWRHPQGVLDKPIKGRAITAQGNLTGQTAVFSGVAADYPAVSAGPNGDLLLAWQDQPVSGTNMNIYGQMWGNKLYIPIVLK